MKGFAFTLVAIGVFIVTLLLMAYVLHITENLVDSPQDQLSARINGAYYHLSVEYKGITPSVSSDTSKGCVPVITLDLDGDPITRLAKPDVTPVCGG